MSTQKIAGGVVHSVPKDLEESLTTEKEVVALWDSITPLARNEWICWVENAKQLETRKKRIARVSSELKEGMRRPCCWIGCIHRKDKEISPSVKYILGKQRRN